MWRREPRLWRSVGPLFSRAGDCWLRRRWRSRRSEKTGGLGGRPQPMPTRWPRSGQMGGEAGGGGTHRRRPPSLTYSKGEGGKPGQRRFAARGRRTRRTSPAGAALGRAVALAGPSEAAERSGADCRPEPPGHRPAAFPAKPETCSPAEPVTVWVTRASGGTRYSGKERAEDYYGERPSGEVLRTTATERTRAVNVSPERRQSKAAVNLRVSFRWRRRSTQSTRIDADYCR